MKKTKLMKLAQAYAEAFRIQQHDEFEAALAEKRARELRRVAIISSNTEQEYHSALLTYIEESA